MNLLWHEKGGGGQFRLDEAVLEYFNIESRFLLMEAQNTQSPSLSVSNPLPHEHLCFFIFNLLWLPLTALVLELLLRGVPSKTEPDKQQHYNGYD